MKFPINNPQMENISFDIEDRFITQTRINYNSAGACFA